MGNSDKQEQDVNTSIAALRRLSPAKRLEVAFDLSDFSRDLFLRGLRKRFPEKTEEEIRRIFLERIDKCHNANY
jgi:hypothetical protein